MRIINAFFILILGNFLFSESILFKNASIYAGDGTEILEDHDLYVVDGKIFDIRKNIEV